MNVPSDASSAGDNPDVGVHERYVFTEDWLTPRLDLWKRLFEDFVGAPSLRFVEVGVYEGRATTWLLDHVLTAPDSTIDCVDPFRSGAGTAMPDPVAIRSRFLANLDRSGARQKVRLHERPSVATLGGLAPERFDAVYVDGSHLAADVLMDGMLALRLLRSGGLLIFDDYLLHQRQGVLPGRDDPRTAIDAIVAICAPDRAEVLWSGYQCVLRKSRSFM